MALRDKLDSKLAGAWLKLDDIPIPAVVNVVTSTTYDPATSAAVTGSTPYNVEVVLTSLTEKQSQDLTGGLGQYQCLVRLAEIDIVPAINDEIIIDGESYNIVDTDVDPARVLWTGFLSKKGKIDNGLAG